MSGSGEKQRKRSSLLPGMGGRPYHRKQKLILECSVLIGLGIAVLMATLMYWMDHLGP
jgi:hypothetical protein